MSTSLGAVDVGGSHVTAAVVELDGGSASIRNRRHGSLDAASGAGELLDRIRSVIGDLREGVPEWTFALPGPFDYEHGTGSFEGVGKFEALAGVDLRAALADRLRVTGRSVRFLNDASAYAIGEWVASALRPRRLVCITLGTGVGSAFLDQGRVVDRDPRVPPQGWVHLLEIDGAPLERTVSTEAIRRAFRRETGRDAEVVDIAALARTGDAAADRVITGAMAALGGALGPWLQRFEADELVVGGSMSRSWDRLGPQLTEAVRRFAPRIVVAPAVAVDDAPLLGAALWRSRGG